MGIEQKLKELHTEHIRIDGHTPLNRRQEQVARFQENEQVRVALLSITAAGTGLTLTAAHTVVFAELYWVPGQMMQAEDRAHRIGQVHSVDVHYCIAEGTLDEVIFGSLNKKSKDTTSILNGAEACMQAVTQDLEGLEAWRSRPGGTSAGSPRKRSSDAAPKGIAKFFKASTSQPQTSVVDLDS